MSPPSVAVTWRLRASKRAVVGVHCTGSVAGAAAVTCYASLCDEIHNRKVKGLTPSPHLGACAAVHVHHPNHPQVLNMVHINDLLVGMRGSIAAEHSGGPAATR